MVNANQAASDAAELALSNQIADIISNVDPAALDSLREVAEAFQAADGDLSAAITAALGTHTSELATEKSDRISGDAATLASAKVYTDTLEALHVADKAAADAAIVAAKVVADAAAAAMQANVDQNEADADAEFVAMTKDYKAAAEKAKIDLSLERNRAVEAELLLTTNLNAERDRAVEAELLLTTNLNAEIERAEGAESLLDGRILDVINNTNPEEIDSVREAVNSFNNILTENFGYLYSQKIGGELFDTMGKETSPMLDFYPYDTFMSGSDMVVVNGLIQSEGSDYEFFRNDILGSDYEGSVGIRFGGDALTLVNEGAPVIFYGTPDSISYVDISKPTEGPFNWDEGTVFGGREGKTAGTVFGGYEDDEQAIANIIEGEIKLND